MPLTDKGQKIMAHMKQEYGPDRGERVFYASRNAGRITGVDPGHARGGIVDHDQDPELPRNHEDDAQLIPLTEAYDRTIQTLRANARQPQASLGQARGYAEGGSAKYTQEQVDYRRGYPLRQCSVCDMYRKLDAGNFGDCTDVQGDITPYGVCQLFARLDNPYGNRMTAEHERQIGQVYDHAHGNRGHSVPYNNRRRNG